MDNISTIDTRQKPKNKKVSKSVRKLRTGLSRIKRTVKSLTKVFTKNRQSFHLNEAHSSGKNTLYASDDSGIDTTEHDIDNNNKTIDSISTVIGPETTYNNCRPTVIPNYHSTTTDIQRQFNVTFVKTVTSPPIAVKVPRIAMDSQTVITKCQTEDRRASKSEYPAYNQSSIPAVKSPGPLKSELYSIPYLFIQLDRRAIQIARRRCYDLEKVSLRLTQKCTNDLEKARVLFRWVVAKDLISRNAKNLNWTVSTVEDISDPKSKREMFHRLFQTMCHYVGLQCEVIQGYSKGSGYKPGMRIKGDTFRNCWTAVAIDNTWRLVNCTWAARHMTSTRLSSCDEFYFLTDPQEHIFQHYPDEAHWQLLEEPLPFPEFTKLPLVKSPFFNNCLRFQTTYTSQVNSTNGKAQIKLTVPSGVKLGSRLQASRSNGSSPHNIGVSRRINRNEAVFTVHSSRPGRCYLSIYATSSPEEKCMESACMFAVNFTEFNSQQL